MGRWPALPAAVGAHCADARAVGAPAGFAGGCWGNYAHRLNGNCLRMALRACGHGNQLRMALRACGNGNYLPSAFRAGAAALALALSPSFSHAQGWEPVAAPTTASLRGVSVPSEDVVWVSGARGTVARSADRGATWTVFNVPGADSLDFRDIEAFDASTAAVLSIGNGNDSRIYRTRDGGASWTLQFTNPDSAAFYDCFAFWSPDRGIAMSDPVDGRFRILRTDDGGTTWMPLPYASSPEALQGEAGFAASGGCVATAPGGHAWITTGGGTQTRILRTTDYGASWEAHPIAPIAAGASPRGAFAVAARDARTLVAVGGDYEQPANDSSNVALSTDGGVSWRPPSGRRPGGYRSGVAIVPGGDGRVLVAVGTSGTDYSSDGGESWTAADTLALNAVAFATDGTGWAVGPRGRVARWRGGFGANYIRITKESDR